MTVKSAVMGGRRHRSRRPEYRRRFGLSADAVRPLFGELARHRPAARDPRPAPGGDAVPSALALYEPGLSGGQRFLARLGTSGTISFGLRPRPVSTKGLVSVTVGGVVGMMVAQPFDAVTFVAPLYGLMVGSVAGAVGWISVRRRRASIIQVDDWRAQLETISRILQNADRIGSPSHRRRPCGSPCIRRSGTP